ncbi:hypothetical protein Tco_0533732 [Tanacetum coccineum]
MDSFSLDALDTQVNLRELHHVQVILRNVFTTSHLHDRCTVHLGMHSDSNCKFLAERIKTLEARISVLEGQLEMARHPENHTLESAGILHEIYQDRNLNIDQELKREGGYFMWMDASPGPLTPQSHSSGTSSRPSHSPGTSSRPSHSPRSAQNLGMAECSNSPRIGRDALLSTGARRIASDMLFLAGLCFAGRTLVEHRDLIDPPCLAPRGRPGVIQLVLAVPLSWRNLKTAQQL